MIQDKKIQDKTMDSDLCIHESDTQCKIGLLYGVQRHFEQYFSKKV